MGIGVLMFRNIRRSAYRIVASMIVCYSLFDYMFCVYAQLPHSMLVCAFLPTLHQRTTTKGLKCEYGKNIQLDGSKLWWFMGSTTVESCVEEP